MNNVQESCEGTGGDTLAHEGWGPFSITGSEGLDNLQEAIIGG